ncbi:Thioesterase family protein [Rhynchospora pubera]|uniref:Thioesterase family protein n=1 Tax=Rhynchospora pubera TaxID=906938 RepID=A0AAV8CWM5_9POAL|nr:Thioesterase family protein [Rhynchospora pubera]KAJ4811938.1 Thioesterase family protein [Rhynchospora pubera]
MASSPPADSVARLMGFFRSLGILKSPPPIADRQDFFSDVIRSLLSVDLVEPGHIICTLTVNPTVANPYNTLHGGVVASVTEAMTLACAKTVAGDKEFFLGEMSTSYLSAARIDDKVEVEASILRQGRRVIVTQVHFRIKKTQKLFYTSRTTVYIMPVASL